MKLLPKMYKGSWILLCIFWAMALGDFYSTFRAGDFLQYLETNPIYPYVGMLGIIALNVLVTWFFLMAYEKSKVSVKFMVCMYIVYISFIRIYVIINNLKAVREIKEGIITKELAMAVPQEVKLQVYTSTVVIALAAPVVLAFVSFLIFQIDHDIKPKDL